MGKVISGYMDTRVAFSSVNLGLLSYCPISSMFPTGSSDPTQAVSYALTDFGPFVPALHAAGCKAEAILWDKYSNLSVVCANNALRSALVSNIKTALVVINADGITIDWEASSMTTAQINALVQDLYAALSLIGKTVSLYYGASLRSSPGQLISPSVANACLTYLAVGCYWQWSATDAEAEMAAWAALGYSKSLLLMGLQTEAAGAINDFYGTYAEVLDTLNPPASQGSALISTFTGTVDGVKATRTVAGGVLRWQPLTDAQNKAAWVVANGFGGMQIYTASEDKLGGDPRSLLTAIYNGLNGINPPPQAKLSVVPYLTTGWIYANSPSSFPFSQVSHLIISTSYINTVGVIELGNVWAGDGPMNTFIAAAHAARVKVLMGFSESDTQYTWSIATDPTKRAKFVSDEMALVTRYGFDGIVMDLENGIPQSSADLLAAALAQALHALGKILSWVGTSYAGTSGVPFDVSLSGSQNVDMLWLEAYDMGNNPYHELLADAEAYVNRWISAGYPNVKLVLGLSITVKDAGSGWFGFYKDVVAAISPPISQDSAVVATLLGHTVLGGTAWWGGPDYNRKKADWCKAAGIAGIGIWWLDGDVLNDPKSQLLAISQEAGIGSSYVFAPSSSVTAKFTNNLHMGGISCQQEFFVGPDDTHKVVSAGIQNFVADGSAKKYNLSVTLPAQTGAYQMFILISYQGQVILEYVGLKSVTIS